MDNLNIIEEKKPRKSGFGAMNVLGWIVGILAILGFLGMVVITIIGLCILGGPMACVIPGFWH